MAKKEAQVQGQDVELTEAEKLEKFKQSKRDAAKRFKERRAEEKSSRIENAKKLIERTQSVGIWDKFTDEEKAFLTGLANPTSAAGTESTFNKLFGSNPQVGATCTLADAFNKTLKGKNNLDNLIKKWGEKGIVVSFKQDAANILNSTYTLEALGN